jgi:hydrogenase maturation protease
LLKRIVKQNPTIGVQPVELEDFGGSLRDKVKAQIQPAIEECLKYLDGYGIEYKKRTVCRGPSNEHSCTVWL